MATEIIHFHDSVRDTLLEIIVSREDAERVRTDNLFATQLLRKYLNEEGHASKSADAHNDPGNFEFLDCDIDETGIGTHETVDHTSQDQETDVSLYRWSSDCILLLLETYKLKQKDLESGKTTQKKVWEQIAQELIGKGYAVTGTQCSSKFRKLKSTYHSIRNHNKFGNDRRNWQFFDIMDEFLADKGLFNPVSVASSTGFTSKHSEINDSVEESQNGSSSNKNNSSIISLLGKRFKQKEHEENTAKRHKERSDMETASTSAENDAENFQFLDCSIDEKALSIQETSSHTFQVQETDVSLGRWSSTCVLLLLETYRLKQKDLKSGKTFQKIIWEQIAQELTGKGFAVTGAQCSSKFRSLKKTYKSVKSHNNKFGNDKRNWQFFEIMDEFLAASSTGLSSKQFEINDSVVESQNGSSSRTNKSSIISLFEKRLKQKEDHEENRTKRHKERMDMETGSLAKLIHGKLSKESEINDSIVESQNGFSSKTNKSPIISILGKRLKQREEHEEYRAKRHKERMEMDKNFLRVLKKLTDKSILNVI